MSVGLDYGTARLWLHLRDDGAWWTAQGLFDYWRPVFDLEQVQQMLDYLCMHGFAVHRLSIDWGALMYAVTPHCRALPGYALEGAAAC